MHVSTEAIDLCRFRGHGWPGLMTIRRRSGGMEYYLFY